MTIDLYTKSILTVIMFCLIWIGINLTPKVSAGPEIVQVDVAKIDGRNISKFGTPLPVLIVER
jgi:hypothetical protein